LADLRTPSYLPSTTITTWLTPGKPAFNNGVSSAYTRFYVHGIDRTIHGTGPAFHTTVLVDDSHPVVIQPVKNCMGTNVNTDSAIDTFVSGKINLRYSWKILHLHEVSP
jgi:hypothetical protein